MGDQTTVKSKTPRALFKAIKYLGIFTSVIFLGVFLFLIYTRSTLYPYDVEQDYTYSFRSHQSLSIPVTGNTVILPCEISDIGTTRLIRLKLSSSLVGHAFQPYILLSNGEHSLRQYFEHGADGFRYINISPLNCSPGSEIRLSAKNLKLHANNAELITFIHKPAETRNVLVFAPHPDDAEIAAFGLYADARQAHVVTITAGDSGSFKYDEVYENTKQHFKKKGEVRSWNSVTTPMLGHVPIEQTLNLGFFDGTLALMFKNKNQAVKSWHAGVSDRSEFRKFNISTLDKDLNNEATWNALVENLSNIILETNPEIIVTPHPNLDSNIDHKLTTVALLEALALIPPRQGQLFLYSNHFVQNELFPYGEEGSIFSLPPNLKKPAYFDSIYSHTLNNTRQNDKIFALESMNDLRPDTEWRTLTGSFKFFIKKARRTAIGLNKNYFRRSVRANELFFVIDLENIYQESIRNDLLGKFNDF